MSSVYVQCLVCGKMTPTRKGICYHCNSPLPSKLELPPGMVVCPNCLRPTSVETGYCRRCNAYLPPTLVQRALDEAKRIASEARHMSRIVGPRLSVGVLGGYVIAGGGEWRRGKRGPL
ncbi:MAG: zinc ribbon domain-containing protein [Desulfurococcales archaeon]|nr:zinc ribbon domain-containing protein [Desulfurococcales archaeon]